MLKCQLKIAARKPYPSVPQCEVLLDTYPSLPNISSSGTFGPHVSICSGWYS